VRVPHVCVAHACAWHTRLRMFASATERKGGVSACQSPSPVHVELTLRIGHSTPGQSAAVITTSSASAFLVGATWRPKSPAVRTCARGRDAAAWPDRHAGAKRCWSYGPIASWQREEPAGTPGAYATSRAATESCARLGAGAGLTARIVARIRFMVAWYVVRCSTHRANARDGAPSP
jgi:hypothetical protein